MGHPDKGLIQALLDGEVPGTEAGSLRSHIDGCPECRAGAEALEGASRVLTGALLLVDTEADFVEARGRFLARVRPPSRRPFWPSISLARAASITLLLTGAAVTSLPGSPVRRWMAQGWEALTGFVQTAPGHQDPAAPGPDQAAPSEEAGIPETGAGIPTSTQGTEVWIYGLPAEAELRVVWTDGDEAWVYSGEGTRFNRVGSRLEAHSPPGTVRVEIPRKLEQVVVGLNGSVLLRKSGGEVEILGTVRRRSSSEVVFDAPGSTNDGRS